MSSLDAYRESRSPSCPAERTKVMVVACSLCAGGGYIVNAWAEVGTRYCPHCNGDGLLRMVPKANACLRCRGDGVHKYQDGVVCDGEPCIRCRGTGREPPDWQAVGEAFGEDDEDDEEDGVCGTCGGEGWVYAHEATTTTKDCPECKP